MSDQSVEHLSKLSKYQGLEKTLQALEHTDRPGIHISRDIIYCLLQACTKKKDLAASRQVHKLMVSWGLDSITVLGDHLIRSFASCGSLQEANRVFLRVSKPSVYTWNAILLAHIKLGQSERALQFYNRMREGTIKPDIVTFLSLLKGCCSLGAMLQGRLIHDHILTFGLESDIVIGNTLVDMYAKCGSLGEAHAIFRNLAKRNVVSWGAIIAGYAHNVQGISAIELFGEMKQEGIQPDKVTFLSTLKACGCTESIYQGRLIHDQIISSGLDADAVIGNTLVNMYAKCGNLEEARTVFNKLLEQTMVSWGAMIYGYAQHGHGLSALELFEKMQERGMKPDMVSFLCILKACGSIKAIEQGRLIHSQIINSGLEPDVVVGNGLIDMYAKCGSLGEAVKVFDVLTGRNVMSWGAIIAGYVLHGNSGVALELFERMQQEGIKPSEVTFSCALKACATIGSIMQGRLIHVEVSQNGLTSNSVIGNTLVDMYAKCGSLEEAHTVFEKLPNRDVVSWGAMMAGYVHHGHSLCALDFFQKMRVEGLKPSTVTLSCALKASGTFGVIQPGRLIHDEIVRIGISSDAIIKSSLVDMYVRCKCLEEAHKIFNEWPDPDVVSWAALIAGYAHHRDGILALQLFTRIQEGGTNPDKVTFLCILKACGSIGAIEQGRLIHDLITRSELETDVVIGNTLIDMYVKCGDLGSAHKVFDDLPAQNVVSWGAIIAGYAQYGNFKMAQQCLEDMKHLGLKPDGVIFTNVLAACSHAGQLEQGRSFFKSIREDHGMAPNGDHYSCMIDLLGRSGCLSEAIDYLETMPGSPDFIVWMSLLSSCTTYCNVELGRRCFDEILQLNPDDASGYVLMSDIYAAAQMWDEVDKLQDRRKFAGAWKKPGIAWIEVDNNLHEFVVGGQGHPQIDEIFSKLNVLNTLLKRTGYWPQLDSVMESLLDGNKEDALSLCGD